MSNLATKMKKPEYNYCKQTLNNSLASYCHAGIETLLIYRSLKKRCMQKENFFYLESAITKIQIISIKWKYGNGIFY